MSDIEQWKPHFRSRRVRDAYFERKKTPRSQLMIWTDGSICTQNDVTYAGWAALIRLVGDRGNLKKEKMLGGFTDCDSTSNIAELTAAVKGIEQVKPSKGVWIDMFTDSQYLLKSVCMWSCRWQQNGWNTREGEPIKNKRLIKRLVALTDRHHISWRWVRGHSGIEHNERVDREAKRQSSMAADTYGW